MVDGEDLRAAGTSPSAIRHHYDLSDDFFRIWLGEDMVYSCALWDDTESPRSTDTLAQAQQRKLDHFATELGVAGGQVLDIGCGWGALLDRFVHVHGATGGVGLTLSPAQQAFAAARNVPGAAFEECSWVDHQPTTPYDSITCIEMSEHLASDRLDVDEKVAVYRAFFDRCAEWLRPDGRIGLQLICLDNVGHEASRPGRGPVSDVVGRDIFPDSMPASLAELVLGWETNFRLEQFLDHPDHYRRTFRAWRQAFRAQHDVAQDLVGPDITRTFERYFAAGELCFRLREHSLYRVILSKRPTPKLWSTPVTPSSLALPEGRGAVAPDESASPEAVRSHYDVSNEFYGLWLGPTMMYSSGLYEGASDRARLDEALARKVDAFAAWTGVGGEARILDVGCGWGWTMRRLVDNHGVAGAVGLTLSEAQARYVAEHPIERAEVRVEGWAAHEPAHPFDAIVSFGAFEHFARDGTTSAQRIGTYRRFFARCRDWLVPDGRLGLETIAHDDAPDTAAPLGRGPLGDFVLSIYPESICPHLSEVVLGFEPYFEVEVLRSDGTDFAYTARSWLLGLRQHEEEAIALVGATNARRWRRYLVASEAQFRLGTITNLRLVLRRRAEVRR